MRHSCGSPRAQYQSLTNSRTAETLIVWNFAITYFCFQLDKRTGDNACAPFVSHLPIAMGDEQDA